MRLKMIAAERLKYEYFFIRIQYFLMHQILVSSNPGEEMVKESFPFSPSSSAFFLALLFFFLHHLWHFDTTFFFSTLAHLSDLFRLFLFIISTSLLKSLVWKTILVRVFTREWLTRRYRDNSKNSWWWAQLWKYQDILYSPW